MLISLRALFFLFCTSILLFADPVEKAVKYHELLLKNAHNEALMTRFLEAWLDEQDRESLEKWLEKEADQGGAVERRVLAGYLEHIGAQERALEQYEVVLRELPGDLESELAVARLRAAGLDFEGALKILGEREDEEAVSLRGTYEHRLGNTKVALELWQALLEEKPENRELREDLVSLFRKEGLGKEARDLQQELVQLGKDPFQRALDQLDLGDLQLEMGLKEEALASFRKVLAVSGSGSWVEREALHKLREIFRRERDADGLQAFLAELREEMPHRLVLQKSFARQLVVTGEVDEGVAAFREILRRTPGDESLRMEFVELLAFAKRFGAAAEELEVLIESEATAERWLRLAELRKENDEEVLETLAEVEALKDGDVAGVLEMARTYAGFDLDEEALRVLKSGGETYADSREISEALAVLLVESEREDEALAIWRAMAAGAGQEEVVRVVQSLRRHGLKPEAFDLLAGDGEGIKENLRALTLYCELALDLGKVEAAWSGARKLIVLPEAFSDLQAAVNLGGVLGRRRGLEEAIADLEKEKGENELCLLASLHQLAGNLPKADAALARAEGELAQRYEVVLLRQRGDYGGAVAKLLGMMGKRVSLVQRKQLLNLLELQGDYEGALVAAEQWKIAFPAEVQAWRKRAELLVQLGRQEEAADELRRARNTFGRDDVDLTRELAKMQLPLGKHREALRLYEHLFRTAKSDEERLKFIDEMYAAARQVGLQDEVVMRFEREHEAAKRELLPLRVLAQLYQLSYNAGARQEVLLKLHRLLPDDEKVLFELVELAEENRDLAGAQQLLFDYAARSRSPRILQRLARMQIKAGEIEAGLKILEGITPGDLMAGDVEVTAVQLWQLGEHQLVWQFLDKNAEVVNGDWRLKFLRGEFLLIVGRIDEARGIWVELLGEEKALGRAFSQVGYQGFIPKAGEMSPWVWWQLVEKGYENLVRTNYGGVGNYLPSAVNEVRWLSLARLAKVSLKKDPTGNSWKVFLEGVNHPWLEAVRSWGLSPQEVAPVLVEKEVEKTPEMRFRILVNELESSREDFLKLASEVAEEKPELANACRVHAAFKLPEGEEKVEELRKLAVLISQEEKGGIGNASQFVQLIGVNLHSGIFAALSEVEPSAEQKEKLKLLEPWWQSWIERTRTGEIVETRELYYPLALQLFTGDFEDFLKNLEGFLGAKLAKQAAPERMWLGLSPYSRPLQGLPDRNLILSHLSSKNVVYSIVYQAMVPRMVPLELREKAREEGWETEGREQLEEFAKKIPQVKDCLLRALLFHKIGLDDKALAEMDALGQEGSLEEKLDVLAFRSVTSRQGPNEALLGALLAMERDGLSPKELSLLDGVTLGEAMKNRRLNELDAEIREDLANVLRRFVKGPGGRAQTSSLQRLYQSLGLEVPTQKRWVSGSGNRQPQSYRQLLSAKGQRDVRKRESEQDRTERRFFEQVKGTFSSSDALGRLQRIVREERYLGLQEKALAFYEPGESLSYLKRMRFAQLCLAYDEREKAREVFLRLQEERPYDDELGMLIFRTQEAKEQAESLDVKLSSGEISTGIDWVALLVKETDEEELFFGYYERLVSLMRRRAEDFSVQDEAAILYVFKRLQRASKNFEKRRIHDMSRRLPRVKKGEDSKEGDWAVRTRQRKILLDAYGEMLRMRSIRDEVMAHIIQSQEALRLSDGHVEWIVLAALKKEAVKENERAASGVAGLTNHSVYRSRGQGKIHLALRAVLEAEVFSAEVVDQLERHVFLSEKQGALIKAALNGDAAEVESLLEEYEEASQAKQAELPHRASSRHQIRQRQVVLAVTGLDWVGLLESLLRSQRWERSVSEVLERSLLALKGEEEFKKWELLRVCELGSLDDSLAALEAAAVEYFPVASKHETYEELRKYGAVPDKVLQKVSAGQSLFTALRDIPRAWIPLLTFAEKSDQAVWVTVDEGKVRSELRRRLDVMYKPVFYDRLREEGFDSYDGLALLGEERWTDSGELSLWLESLIAPLKLAPTEGRTYWANVSQDCREQVEQVSYLEAFIAMRKDFQIEDEERQKLLRQVLESELEELSGLSDDSLIGLRNLIKKDFPELEVSGVSEELDELLTRLRGFPVEGVVKRIEGMIGNEKAMAALSKDEAKGLCACLASEGEVELAAEFWVAFLNGRANGMSEDDFGRLNFNLLARNPFMGKLNLVDSVRFVRLVKEGLVEHPEMTKSMRYTREILQWSKALSDYSSYRGDPAGVLPFLDEMLQGDGVTEADKRVIGGFLIKAHLSGRGEKTSHEVFRLQLLGSGLAEHSPGVVETMLALSQLQGGRERKRVKEEDVKAVKVIYDYVQDQELAPDFRGDLAEWLIA